VAPIAVARASPDLDEWVYAVPVEVAGLPDAASYAAVAAGDTVWLATDQGVVRGAGEVWERWNDAGGPAYALALDADHLWVGGEEGLVALDRRDGSRAASFPARRVVAVALTPEAVYAGTEVGLVAGRRTASVGAGSLPASLERVESRAGRVRALAATATLLLVAGATGLEVFDRRAGAWSPEPRAVEPVSLAVDAEGQVWIGTASGLARWRPATGEWDEWTPADGLAGLPVLHVLAEDGVVWASTPAGASRFAWREAGR
jgi:ligand-binding sensor domain-containing protein